MSRANTNRVVLSGNLTRDPELRSTPSGTSVCSLRLACNTRRKDASGEWVDKPNYFDVTVWGKQGENVAQYLGKGSPVMVDGRLEWREWQDRDGNRRQSTDIIAESVEWLPDGRDRQSSAPAASSTYSPPGGAPDPGRLAGQPAGTGRYSGGGTDPLGPDPLGPKPEDDIPF